MRLTSLLLLLVGALPLHAADVVRPSLIPSQPLIERTRDGQQLNFDLLFDNPGDQALELVKIEVTLYDREGRFFSQRRLDRNGDSSTMSILTIPHRALPAKGRLLVFNPFARFPADTWLGKLHYGATFSAGEDAPAQEVSIDVAPRMFASKTTLSVPLRGEFMVHDGHELTAHHRRLDITGAMTTHFAITGNFMRYAHDLVVTDARGALFRTDGSTPQDWYGYGAPVLATGDGVVVTATDGMRDNVKGGPPPFTQEQVMANLGLFLGNHVVIDHGNGEYSLFAHLKQGSLAVMPGARVTRGEQIGAMGMSGDAFLVHLHYQLQSGPDFQEGLPAYFHDVRVRTGDGWSAPFDGPLDSGDVAEGVVH